jgi:hypothetical protein
MLRQQVHRPDTAAGDGTVALGQFITEVACPEHGMGLILPAPAGQAIPDATPATSHPLMSFSFHLKRLLKQNTC